MRRGSWVGRLLLLPVSAAAPVLLIAAPAGASGVVLRPGHVVEITQPGAPMTVPADGRLRGQDFVARVTGVAWPIVAGVGTRYTAAAGDQLVVFTLRLSQAPDDVPLGGPAPKAAVATLEVAGTLESVDLSDIDTYIRISDGDLGSGTATYVAAVPARTHAANLTLTEGSFSQSLSLWSLERMLPAPPVLYRDPEASSATGSTQGASSVTMADPANSDSFVASVFVNSATLGWFAPDSQGSTPGDPSSAILTVQLQAESRSGYTFYDVSELPGERVTFTPTGGNPVSAQAVPASWMPGSTDIGLLDDTYWFTVPAATTAGTVEVTAGPSAGFDSNDVGAGTVPLEITARASLSINFPAPVAPATQRTPPWRESRLQVRSGAQSGHPKHPSSSNASDVIRVVLVVIGCLVVLLLVVTRRVRFGGSRAPRRVPTTPTMDAEAGSPRTTVGQKPETGAPTSDRRVPVEPAEPVAIRVDPLAEDDELVVRVLGPVEITGWRSPPPGRVTEELCCYLALHTERALGTDQIIGALWPLENEVEVTPKTLRNYASRLRGSVGSDRFPEAGDRSGYRLRARTDWQQFRELVAQARGTEGVDADRLRADALTLVRGQPFSGTPRGRYSWAYSESLASDMVVAVVDCAHRLSADLLAQRDIVGAEAAARSGLRASPAEEQLWIDAVAAARAHGDAAAMARLVRDAELAAGPEVAKRLSTELPAS